MTSLQCVEAFSPAQPGEEQNREGYGLQSGQYLHSLGGVVTFNLTILKVKQIHYERIEVFTIELRPLTSYCYLM